MVHSWAKLLTRSKISQKAVLFKNELLSCDDSASWLRFYYDVNIINPLTNKLHKLSFFYYNLANIKPIHRSKLESVHLLTICNTSYMKYGINAIFSPVMEDFKVRGNGYPFQVYGGVLRLRGSLLARWPTPQRVSCAVDLKKVLVGLSENATFVMLLVKGCKNCL